MSASFRLANPNDLGGARIEKPAVRSAVSGPSAHDPCRDGPTKRFSSDGHGTMEALDAVDGDRSVHRARDLEHCHAGNLQVGAFECAAIPRNFIGWHSQA